MSRKYCDLPWLCRLLVFVVTAVSLATSINGEADSILSRAAVARAENRCSNALECISHVLSRTANISSETPSSSSSARLAGNLTLSQDRPAENEELVIETTEIIRRELKRKEIVELRTRFPNKTWDYDMFLAISQQNETALQFSVELGADINAIEGRSKFTPLHKASQESGSNPEFALKAVKLLINEGANVTCRDYLGNTFLHYLSYEMNNATQFDDITRFLISKNLSHLFNSPGRISPFHIAVVSIEIETGTLALLHENGVDFNAVLPSSLECVLAYAVMSGRRSLKMISDFVNFGANPKHVNAKGESLLHIAASFSSADVVKYFIDLGLEVNALDKYGQSPLMNAVLGNNPLAEKVRVLIKNGADAQMKYNGQTILHRFTGWSFNYAKDRFQIRLLLENNE